MLRGPKRGGGSCRHTDPVVDVLDVVISSLGGDEELAGDLLRREIGDQTGTDPFTGKWLALPL